MPKKKNKGRDEYKEAAISQFVDDNGVVIEDIREFLNKPDEDLKREVEEELKQTNLLDAKAEFAYKLKKFNYLGIGYYLKPENLDEFIDWLLKFRIL